MAIFIGRRPEDQFTRVPNSWARDPKLSFKGKGILAFMLSYPDGYQLTVDQLVTESSDGRTAVYAALRELIDRGYVRREQRRHPGGTVGEVDYHVADAPGRL